LATLVAHGWIAWAPGKLCETSWMRFYN